MTRYRTIVADPPWDMGSFGRPQHHRATKGAGRNPMPYAKMSVEAICALPVTDLAEDDAHLYLWTTNRYLRDAFDVAEAWGFTFSTLLVWAKAPRGIGPGGAHCVTTEFALFCRRGSLQPLSRVDSTWWSWKRPYSSTGPIHSAKPDGFLDMVEAVSPGPYCELFARRARFGWDYWGNESLGTAELDAA